jgi:cbb3-type cytochrome c oxidase subunit III
MRLNKHLLLWSSLGTLVLLAWSAYQENVLREWRRIQRGYEGAGTEAIAAGFRVQLRQIVVPELGATDRCVSCHVGMTPGETPLEGDRVLGSHPDVYHEPGEYGCVVCHGGQGRATQKADAHGDVPHWPEPMIPDRYAFAGCGTCHTHLAVPNLERLERGRALVERYDCLACHSIDGRGGTTRPGGDPAVIGPDLSRVGEKDIRGRWYDHHLDRYREQVGIPGPWTSSFGEIPPAQLAAINTFLSSRVGAPGLVEAKALFHTLGCRGCHKIGGVGGDDGPDLSHVGNLDPGQLDFTHVPGEKTVANWIAEHFRAPAQVVPGSQMPYLGLSGEEIDELTYYMFSLRRSVVPEAFWPVDRIRAERFGEREFSTDGATLYGTFCAACHGREGQGMRYPGMTAFPAIGNPDFLAIASDGFIAETIRHGRPGRRMPAWGETEGGLRPEEIMAIVGHIREMTGIRPEEDPRPSRWVRGDAALGGDLYTGNCASCHGPSGEGGTGPALSNTVLLDTATDTYLVQTILRGRRGTSMEGFSRPSTTRRTLTGEEAESIVAFMRGWEKKP